MPTVKFLLNRPNDANGLKKTPVAILARVSIHREQRFVLTTKETIIPKYWDSKTQRAKANMTGSVEMNLSLRKIEGDVLQLWRENKTLPLSELKEKSRNLILFGSEETPVQKKRNDLELFIQDYIKKCEEGQIARKPATIQKYKANLRHLQQFSHVVGFVLTFQAITQDFCDAFCAFLWDYEDTTKRVKTKGYGKYQRKKKKQTDGTVGNQIKYLKHFMQQSLNRKLHTNRDFELFEKLDPEADSIYLNQEEILQIYHLDLSQHERLIGSRDLFVFDCWVGLRYTDVTSVKPNHIKESVLRISTIKTGEDVVIPIHPIAQAIHTKYNGNLPIPSSNQEYNEDLKRIGELAGIKEKVQRRRTVRNVVEFEWVNKYEMIVAHTARRSFATNCYKMGVPAKSIMAMTGHKTEKSFNKYIKLSKEEHKDIVLEHFQKATIMKVSA